MRILSTELVVAADQVQTLALVGVCREGHRDVLICKNQQVIPSQQFWIKAGLTALSLGPPAVRDELELQAAGSDVVLQELTLDAVHVRIYGQGVCAGGDVGLWVDGAGVEGRLLQEVTAAPHKETETETRDKKSSINGFI